MSRPTIPNYRRHVLICAGKTCDPEGGRRLVRHLKRTLETLGVGPEEVRVNRAGCLGVCEKGAIVCVYPEAVWYCGIDSEAAVERLVRRHLLGGELLEEHLMHRNRWEPEGDG